MSQGLNGSLLVNDLKLVTKEAHKKKNIIVTFPVEQTGERICKNSLSLKAVNDGSVIYTSLAVTVHSFLEHLGEFKLKV